MIYDWLVVGSGISGAIFAREMTDRGYKCLVIDKRPQTGGNCYCEDIGGVAVHKYGAHIFHTSSQRAWDYLVKYLGRIRRLGIYTVQAMSGGEVFPLPFNMNTFAKIWPNVRFPQEARQMIERQAQGAGDLETLEGAAISQVGRDVFEKLVKGYTEKQWGRPCRDLPKEIIGRIPVRFTYDNNYYFCDKIGIPEFGYNGFFENILDGIEVRLCCDFLTHRELADISRRVFYTGPIDALFEEKFGRLDYRSLRFEYELADMSASQGCPVMNYCDHSVEYTRRIEHNQFAPSFERKHLVVTYEYSQPYQGGAEPYYPVPSKENEQRYARYLEESRRTWGDKFVFGGRLGRYKYFAMDDAILDTLGILEGLANE